MSEIEQKTQKFRCLNPKCRTLFEIQEYWVSSILVAERVRCPLDECRDLTEIVN